MTLSHKLGEWMNKLQTSTERDTSADHTADLSRAKSGGKNVLSRRNHILHAPSLRHT